MCWCFPVKTVYFGTNIKDVLSSPSRRFPRETEQNSFVIRIKRNLFSFFVLFLLRPLGLSEANRVRSPLPSSTSREKISDRHHVGSLFQRSDHLRGPEWKPFSCAQVSLEGHKKDFLYCENLIPILIYHKNSAFFVLSLKSLSHLFLLKKKKICLQNTSDGIKHVFQTDSLKTSQYLQQLCSDQHKFYLQMKARQNNQELQDLGRKIGRFQKCFFEM